MTAKVYSEFCKGARILVPYIFLQEIGFTASIILSEILAEYNYASNNKVDDYLGFIFDVERASKVLNIAVETIVEQLEYLHELKFIIFDSIGLADSLYIRVYDDNILNFKKELEVKNFNNDWDAGLLASVNPIHKKVDFSESTLKIKHYFDTNAKNPKSIPMLEYLLLNYWVKCYENIDGNIFEVFSDMDDFIQQCATKDNSRNGIQEVTNQLEIAYRNLKKQQNELLDEIPPDCD
ncbi:hypothetical protein IJ541_07210 [bacterium]|nr:hypothetical protein [bacterium]